ncbi:MAG: hypothetical protein Q7J75_00785 [Rhodoferax sp.]|nr:hypothetical protein [Rhodoferax sp.]
MRTKLLALVCSFGVSCLAVPLVASAQSLRDPTLPPPEAGLADPLMREKAPGLESGAISIIVRDGRRYVVVGTRLFSQGQKLGQARIERISETEVWLREDGVLRKVDQFSGIERRAAQVQCVPAGLPRQQNGSASSAATAASVSKSPSPVVPCVSAQPRGLSK